METVDIILAKDVLIDCRRDNIIKVDRVLVVGNGVTKELVDKVAKKFPNAVIKFVDGEFYCGDLIYTEETKLASIENPDDPDYAIMAL